MLDVLHTLAALAHDYGLIGAPIIVFLALLLLGEIHFHYPRGRR